VLRWSNSEIMGTNPEEELERRARRSVSYLDISISSFSACAVELQGTDGGNIVGSNPEERRESVGHRRLPALKGLPLQKTLKFSMGLTVRCRNFWRPWVLTSNSELLGTWTWTEGYLDGTQNTDSSVLSSEERVLDSSSLGWKKFTGTCLLH